MRAWFCAAGLLVSFAYANGQDIRTNSTLTILYQFERPYPNRALAEAERELKVLTKGAGVHLEWFDRSGPQGHSSFPNILVFDFLGSCDPRSENQGPTDGWLARMHVSDGVVLPIGEVNCDLVRSVLNQGVPKTKPNDAIFGRALARVLAHELYHFMTNRVEHLQVGLAKPSLSRKDLLSDELNLDLHTLDHLSNAFLP